LYGKDGGWGISAEEDQRRETRGQGQSAELYRNTRRAKTKLHRSESAKLEAKATRREIRGPGSPIPKIVERIVEGKPG